MKKVLSFFLFVLIFSFVGILFSSFVVSTDIIVQLDAESLTEFFKDHWAVMALIISEVAALLPSKPKGIIQSFVFVITKIINRSNVQRKNLEL